VAPALKFDPADPTKTIDLNKDGCDGLQA